MSKTRSRPWMRHAVPVAMAIACAVFVVVSDATITMKVVAIVGFAVAATLWANARELRMHAMVNRYSALGQPESILALIEPELAYSKTPRIRVPFSIYKAIAFSLQGKWAEALVILDDLDITSMRGKTRRTWQFLYYSHRFTCLLFNDRPDEAREILENQIDPFAEIVTSPGTKVIRDEAHAKMAYFEGRRDEAKDAFKALAARGEIAPASRAIYHYFLGRLAMEEGQSPDAHFTRATELAPDTFLPGEIRELNDR